MTRHSMWTPAEILARCPEYNAPAERTSHRAKRRPPKLDRPAVAGPPSPTAGRPTNPTQSTQDGGDGS